MITTDGHPDLYAANPGTAHLDKVYLRAGETLNVQVYTYWDEYDLMPHDWQLVVLGTEGEVTILGDEQIKSKEPSEVWPILGIIAGIIAVFALLLYCAWERKKRRD